MKSYLIKNATVVNEGKSEIKDVLIKDERIERIDNSISVKNATVIDAEGMYLMPGAIDDQVHFREPGLTQKGNIYTESRAAVAGGITSFFEMPNTKPQATTQALLQEKYDIASKGSIANYSFFMGTTNNNYDEVMKTNGFQVCGIKIFMGSSTGNMLVDDPSILDRIFANSPLLIATHCEDEHTIQLNMKRYNEEFGDKLSAIQHPLIRSEEACYLSSNMAVELAKKHGTRLHVLHISTAKETQLFDIIPLEKKRITAEACIHHLWFTDADYPEKGNWIKWNPAIKTKEDREGIWSALMEGRIDVVATDHAPHTIEEKELTYSKAPSGGPLVQHSVIAMFDFMENGRLKVEDIVQKMCHNPAILFRLKNRGFIREGYYADLVLVKKQAYKVSKENILYKC
ncbi:MAG: dihydroorotase, partial [Bacteroidia bacterium]|nr:dihydroorotase [Bacteroidia bacterium]